MNEKLDIMKNSNGFIAALDQSGGSSAKTLKLYGIDEDKYNSEEEMFDLIHDMRKRIIRSKSFTNDKIIGTILFYETMNRKIDDLYTCEYLWDKKKIISFLKVDEGLCEIENGVSLMKPIINLNENLDKALEHGIFGTKMRSVIWDNNEEGIKKIVEQQFILAKKIYSKGLIPIIEPEVSIDSDTKRECEIILKREIISKLNEIDIKVIFKFTIPEEDNFYLDLINHPKVIRVVALSGGYSRSDACMKLKNNNGMIASFSRALLENLNVNDTEDEFDEKLFSSINEIYDASVR